MNQSTMKSRLFFSVIFSCVFVLSTRSSSFSQDTQLPESPIRFSVDVEKQSSRSGHLKTAWGKEVMSHNVHPEYPRPTLVRKDWLNLNGLWEWKKAEPQIVAPIPSNLLSNTEPTVQQLGERGAFSGRILVPFPIESSLSGVSESHERILCRRFFTIPKDWPQEHRIILHFGAVDWETAVYVNGTFVGRHQGGYDSFSFDITDYLSPSRDQNNELLVRIFDPCNYGQQIRGKQSTAPSGIWYNSVTGIWQTVWLEPVAPQYLKSVQLSPDCDSGILTISSQIEFGKSTSRVKPDLSLYVEAFDGENVIAKTYGGIDGPLILRFPKDQLKYWSPDSPFLYQLRIRLLDKDNPVDQLGSYVAFRKIDLIKNALGKSRIRLNGRILFQMGIIDQGYWPDGLYTAPTDQAIQTDIRVVKKLGFNMIRKHAKIEPERWYFWCDRLGILVWQDIPNGDNRTAASQEQFRRELEQAVKQRSHHPSIIVWTLFNEALGQHKTEEYVALVRKLDPSRLINNASGWTDHGVGDLNDHHKFPGPEAPRPDSSRAAVIGSFGALTLIPPRIHLWTPETWGYQHVADSESLVRIYRTMHEELRQMIRSQGLSAAVFHQLVDIESECNGLMSYDRAILKIPSEIFQQVNEETIRFGSSPSISLPSE